MNCEISIYQITANQFAKAWTEWSIKPSKQLGLLARDNFPADQNPTPRTTDPSKQARAFLPAEDEINPKFGWISTPEGGRERRG